MRILLISIIGIGLLSSCRNSSRSSRETTIGIACGMCGGECFRGYRLSASGVSVFSTKYLGDLDKAKWTAATSIEADRMKRIVKLLPDNLEKFPSKIGCPDCSDQCAIYISAPTATGTKTIVLDPNEHPKEFDAFVNEVKALQLL